MNGKDSEGMPNMSPDDRASAREWLEEMGFVVEAEQKPKPNSESDTRKPAA